MLAIGCVAMGTTGAVSINMVNRPTPPAAAAALAADDDRITAVDRATRDHVRDGATPTPSDAASTSPAPSAPTRVRPNPKPVKELNQSQLDNAAAIVEAGRKMNMPRRAHIVAVATALQETGLRNLANPRVPQSMNHPHQGSETNYDSIGLFQQRPSQGWGSVAELMEPGDASRLFYNRLLKVGGWEQMSITGAAQAVQRSAFPDAYAKHQSRAEQIVDALI
jgi:hypothetical protein